MELLCSFLIHHPAPRSYIQWNNPDGFPSSQKVIIYSHLGNTLATFKREKKKEKKLEEEFYPYLFKGGLKEEKIGRLRHETRFLLSPPSSYIRIYFWEGETKESQWCAHSNQRLAIAHTEISPSNPRHVFFPTPERKPVELRHQICDDLDPSFLFLFFFSISFS